MDIYSVPVSALIFDPTNARLHGPENISAIAGSLEAFGQRRPLVVRGDVVIAGNGTLEAARSLGWEDILVTQVPEDWSDDQARAYAVADNRTAELATWDDSVLSSHFESFARAGLDISVFGFDELVPVMGEDAALAFVNVPDGPRNDATQMTFTVTLQQGEMITDALRKAKASGRSGTVENTNSNGNAIVLIVSEWLASGR